MSCHPLGLFVRASLDIFFVSFVSGDPTSFSDVISNLLLYCLFSVFFLIKLGGLAFECSDYTEHKKNCCLMHTV